MDKDEFKQRIQQYAVIKEAKPKRHSSDRLKKEIVIEVDEFGEEVEIERDVKLENDTLPFELVSVINSQKACELGCGKILDNQQLQHWLNRFPYKHWRVKCVTCGKHLGPDGVSLCENATKAQSAFYTHYLRTK